MTGKPCRMVPILACALLWFGMFAAAPASFAQRGRQVRIPPGMQPNQPGEPAFIRVRVDGSQVDAVIRVTPLQQVLAELAARTGIIFEIADQLNPEVSITLPGVSIEEAVTRLMEDNDSIIYYDTDESGKSRISFVRIIPRNPLPTPPSLRYIGTGAVTKQGDDTLDSPEAAIKALAGSDDLMERQRAIEVLVTSKSPVAVRALTLALSDPEVEIRSAAIDGLAALEAHEALPRILSALKDSHPGVRQSAIEAVSLLGNASNIKNLQPLLRDQDAAVAAAAEVAIRNLSIRVP